VRPFPDVAKTPKNVFDAGSREPKFAEDEPDPKAILPEPRRIKKANYYQFHCT